VATCAIYFLVWHRKGLPGLLVMAGIGLGLGGLAVHRERAVHFNRFNELYRANSNFGLLQVIEMKNAPRRYYLNDYLVQNTYDAQNQKSTSLFTYMLRYLAQAYTTNLQNVLCIGLGVGIAPKELAARGARLDVVEINPDVAVVAEKYFDFQPDKARIIFADGRYVVNSTTNKYDAVLLDAFLGDSSPSHLMTREAFEQMKRILNPDGVLVINSFGDFAPKKDFFVSSLYKTLTAVFPFVRIHGTGNGNVFFAASPNPNSVQRPVNTDDAHPEVAMDVRSCLASSLNINPTSGQILTDDFNPVEFHDAVNREEHRRRLAMSLRKL
jgi:spermidine synthase